MTSEAVVQHALEKAQKNRTTITIAHRLTTVKSADQIVVMRKGSVIEAGAHEELAAIEGGVYKRLWDAQARVSRNQYSMTVSLVTILPQ